MINQNNHPSPVKFIQVKKKKIHSNMLKKFTFRKNSNRTFVAFAAAEQILFLFRFVLLCNGNIKLNYKKIKKKLLKIQRTKREKAKRNRKNLSPECDLMKKRILE